MKQLIIIAAILFSAFEGYAQQMTFPSTYNKEEYDQLRAKSKHERVTGIILTSGGGVLILGGAITSLVGVGEAQTDVNGDIIPGSTNDKLIRAGLIIAGVGVVAEFVSIPFFVKSHSDKKQAREIRFHANSSSYAFPVSGFKSVNQPQLGISCSISL
jgi:hypothetical protein